MSDLMERWDNGSLLNSLHKKHRKEADLILTIKKQNEKEGTTTKSDIHEDAMLSENTVYKRLKHLKENELIDIEGDINGRKHDVRFTKKGNQIADILYPLKVQPSEIEAKAKEFRRKTLRWPDTDEMEEITGRELNIETLRHIEDFRSPTNQIKERKREKLQNRLEKAVTIKDKEAEVERLKKSSSEEWRKAAQYCSDNEDLMDRIEKKSSGKYKVPKDMENYVNKDELKIQPLPAI